MAEEHGKWAGNFGRLIELPIAAFQASILNPEAPGGPGGGLVNIHSTDGKAHPVSVTLVGPMHNDPICPGAELVAGIVWGNEGVQSTALVDVIEGQVINLVASSVKVNLVHQMVNPLALPATPPAPTAGAFASPGFLPRNAPPQRTFPFYDATGRLLASGARWPIMVPRFAKKLQLACLPATSVATVEVYTEATWPLTPAAVLIAEYPLIVYPSEELPLPNDIAWATLPSVPPVTVPILVLYNAGKAAITAFRAVFALSL